LKVRLDQIVVDRGLAESRTKAQALILAGQVLINGQKAGKAGHAVDLESRVEVLAPPPFVSRGGVKLEAALKHFAISVQDKTCLDIGSSTGGFTDCLLQSGAKRVYAFDVGTNQLDWKLRSDPRVVSREQVNARYLTPADLPEPIDLAVCDVSFISVTMILPVLPSLLTPVGQIVILVKPQFEVERSQVGKGGIVRDPLLHQAACLRVEQAVAGLGYRSSIFPSPLPGAEGNQEFLLFAVPELAEPGNAGH
jgi:23S rRNA (cytidine1920-2'-O)/16S rRNA (cytidine1409-2'-O)-methyltransferase